MDFVTHLPQTSRGHDAIWMIVDRLTKSAHLLAARMTITLEEFYKLYIWEIVRLHGVSVSIVSNKFPASHGDIVHDEHNFSSLNKRSIKEDHPDVRGYDTDMCP